MTDYSSLTAGYERFNFAKLAELGLKEDPFVDSTDPRYLYLGDENMPMYKAALQGIVRRRGLMAIVGEPGLGKTILAKRLRDVLASTKENDIDVAYFSMSNWETKFRALQMLCTAFPEITVPIKRSYDEQMEALQDAIVDSYSKGRNVVIILDDAHMMSSSAMSMIHQLYNFSAGEKTVQSILFGQLETIEMLKKNKAVWSRVFQSLMMARFDLAGTAAMVNYRVRVAGRLEPLFDDLAFLALDNYANGVPRDIISVCSVALDLVLQRGGKVITQEVIQNAIESLGKDKEHEAI